MKSYSFSVSKPENLKAIKSLSGTFSQLGANGKFLLNGDRIEFTLTKKGFPAFFLSDRAIAKKICTMIGSSNSG